MPAASSGGRRRRAGPWPAITNEKRERINNNLNVPAGAICRLYGNEVQGNITVGSGATLHVFGLTADGNVTVNGGSFVASNHGVTIDGNLTVTNPAANSENGFFQTVDGSTSLVKGNVYYTITPDGLAAYPQYSWPGLTFQGGVEVNGNVNYSVGATPNRAFDASGLTVLGHTSLS